MNTRSTRPSSASSSGPLTARRIAQPGSFSKLIQRTGCDDKLTSSNSKLTPFQILNPKVDQNIPKISPVQAAQRRNTNASLAEASTTSTTSLNKTLRSDRKRPTSGYIANRQQQLEEEEWEDDPYGTPSPTGNRKCIVELEEELIAKTIQLHKLTLESEQVR